MEKQIGITTSTQSFHNNYGAILQAYALSYKLKELGYIPKIIRYRLDNEYLAHSAPLSKRLKATLFNKQMSFHAKKELLLNRLLNRGVDAVFADFAKEHLDFYNEKYVDFEALKKEPPEYDAFITGSDQVWNPVIHGGINDPGFFLDFVPYGKKRIAYAPSMGVNEIPESAKCDLKDYLIKFDSLSIREQSGADIIKNVCDIDVPIVLDPTLLLNAEEWDTVSKKHAKLPEKYIFVYKFGNSKLMDKKIKELSKKHKLPVVTAPASAETRFKADYTIGPGEFLYAIKNATMIFTDSFHATVFSIIYNKEFLTFPRHEQTKRVTMNSRMENLLEMLEIEDRYISSADSYKEDRLFEISYEKANKILLEKREESISYLTTALRGV